MPISLGRANFGRLRAPEPLCPASQPLPLEVTMAESGTGLARVIGLAIDDTLGDLEQLVGPLCTGPIIGIGREGNGMALVEFAQAVDARAVAGEYELNGKSVQICLPGEAPPTLGKRSRSGRRQIHLARQPGLAPPTPSSPPPSSPPPSQRGPPPEPTRRPWCF